MGIFSRNSSSVESQIYPALDATVSLDDKPFEKFLEQNSGQIELYGFQYSQLGQAVVAMSEDASLLEIVTDEVEKQGQWVRGEGGNKRNVSVEEVSEAYMQNLPMLLVYSTKATLLEQGKIGIFDSTRLARRIGTDNVNTNNISDKVIRSRPYRHYVLEIQNGVVGAEQSRFLVAKNYSDGITQSNDLLPGTIDFYSPDYDSEDPEIEYLAREFKDIAAADLLLGDKGSLQAALQRIKDNPTVFLERFIATVESGEHAHSLRAMAQMAVVFSEIKHGTEVSIGDVLRVTADEWSVLDPHAKNEFLSYAKRQSDLLTRNLKQAIGIDQSGRKRGFRMPVDDKDLSLAVGTFGSLITKLTTRKMSTQARVAKNFIGGGNDFVDQARDGGSEPRPIHLSRKVGNAYLSTEDATDEELEEFIANYAGNNVDLEDDVRRMIHEISVNPYFGGYKASYVKSAGEIKIDTPHGERHVKMMEFSPQDRSFKLKSGKAGKRTRITYALTQEGVHIFRILHHDDFDAVYNS